MSTKQSHRKLNDLFSKHNTRQVRMANTSTSSTTANFLGEALGNQTVKIYVGEKRKEFLVHKDLLCKTSDFFAKGFNGGFKESQEGEMYLPEDSPGAFFFLVDWIYRSTLPTTFTEAHIPDLYRLYILADKLCIPTLKDKTMDSIQILAKELETNGNVGDAFISKDIVLEVFSKFSWMEKLPKFIIWLMVDIFLHREKGRKLEVKASDLNLDDLKYVWDISKENFEISLSFQVRMLTWETSDCLWNPRNGQMEESNNRCVFHSHPEDNCK
ncbi:hypothetical protein G7Y89_g6109 [Cudoniella acicularis]|uniref:BTB domain-containing protein n=1 Tax=Cudoniella acicularis TaxID=354080 RepID=A0A8H4RMV3_9HELO|nr:hypothetical protein G7Y89_g6109 [Cudoniella acicularis]